MEQVNIIKPKESRETGFEILRIVSMFFICCVHVLNYGEMLNNAVGSVNSVFAMKLIYALFTTSVNIFILISGYFMINKKLNFKRLFSLWIQVLFYSVVSYIIAVLAFKKAFNWKEFLFSFMPIINKKFWFISAYFVICLISPFLNNMIKNSSEKQMKFLMIGILIFVYITTRFNIKNIAGLENGYSILWFIILYITGAYFKLYPPKWNKGRIGTIYLVCMFATWAMFAYPQTSKFSFLYMCKPEYNSPLVFIASVCIFLMFRDVYVKNSKLHKTICFLSSCMLGVYLFQESYIKYNLYFDILKIKSFYASSVPAWLNVLYLALLIFALGLIIEAIRRCMVKLFRKIYNKYKKQNYVKSS